MRVGVTLAVVGAIVGEWAGAERGPRVLINLARGSLFDIPLMFAALADDRARRDRAVPRRRPRRAPVRRRPLAQRRNRRSSCPSVPDPALAIRRSPSSPPRRPCVPAARPRAIGVLPPPASAAAAAPTGALRRRARAEAPIELERRPRLHPERPVRAVLPRRAGRLLREAGLDVTFQNKIDPDLITLVGQGASTSASPTARASSRRSANGIPISTSRRSTGSSRTSCSPRSRRASRRRPISRAGRSVSRGATARAGSCSRHSWRRPA